MDKKIFHVWWISLVVKLIIGTFMPLFNDEAYYWVWSHNLQLSYYDHPAFVSWLFWLGHPFENFLSLVRLPALLMSHGTIALWLLIAKPISTPQQRLWFLIGALVMPFFGVAGLIVTPDLPLMFFWSLTIYITQIIFSGKNHKLNYAALGLFLGLGFISKYNMALSALVLIPFWILIKPQNFFKSPSNFLIMTVFFILGSLPVFLWNINTNFESFKFQLNHGIGAKEWNPLWPISYTIIQSALLFPTVIFYALKNKKKEKDILLLKLAAWVPLFFFFLTSFKGRVEPNWPLMAHPAVWLLACVHLPQNFPKYLKRLCAFWFVLFAITLIDVKYNLLSIKKTQESKEFDNILPYIENHLAVNSTVYSPIYARSFQMAAQLSFKTKKQIYKLPHFNRRDFYDTKESFNNPETFYLLVISGDKLPKQYLDINYQVKDVVIIDDIYSLWRVSKVASN